jgi:hypothetical protein
VLKLCPGSTYRASFQARRATTAGTVSVALYVDETAYAGGQIGTGTYSGYASTTLFTATDSSAILRLEIGFTGGTGSAKEVNIDEVVLTKVG